MQKGKKKATDADVQMADPEVQMAPPAPDVTLWCVIEGDPRPFRLSVPSGTDVHGLKRAIKDENPNRLKDIDAGELTICKVCTFRLAYSTQLMHSWKLNTNVPLGPSDTLLSRLPAVESWKELKEPGEMLSVLEPLPPNHLHIIVRRALPISNVPHIVILPIDDDLYLDPMVLDVSRWDTVAMMYYRIRNQLRNSLLIGEFFRWDLEIRPLKDTPTRQEVERQDLARLRSIAFQQPRDLPNTLVTTFSKKLYNQRDPPENIIHFLVWLPPEDGEFL